MAGWGCSPFLLGDRVVRPRGLKGQFVSAATVRDNAAETAKRTEGPRRKPAGKRRARRAQQQIADALPEIVETFVGKAKEGSIAHAKALAALGDMDRARATSQQSSRRREQSLTERLMRELRWGREAEASNGARSAE